MSQRHLIPMDIVLYENRLWVVSTSHKTNEGKQIVNIAGYKNDRYKKDVPAYKCKIIHDEKDRKQIEVTLGIYLYPDTDFKGA